MPIRSLHQFVPLLDTNTWRGVLDPVIFEQKRNEMLSDKEDTETYSRKTTSGIVDKEKAESNPVPRFPF